MANAQVNEIPSLDGIRAISVLVVVVSHSGFGTVVPGGLGVTIFFFLSGYLITTLILAEERRSGRLNVTSFYARRIFRLFPPLLITLAIAYALVHAGLLGGSATIEGFTAQLLYFANYYSIFVDPSDRLTPKGTGVLWSLAVEEHYYIIYPLIMYLCLSCGLRVKTFVIGMIAVCAAVLCWRIYLTYPTPISNLRTYYASDTRIDSIVYGCLLAIAINPLNDQPKTQCRMTAKQWGLFAAAFGVLFCTLMFRGETFRETFRYSIQGIALMPIFYFAIKFHANPIFRVLNVALVTKIGVWSYGIYLIHHIVVQSLTMNFPDAGRWLILPVVLAISIAFAAMLDRFVDPYFRALRHRFRPNRAI